MRFSAIVGYPLVARHRRGVSLTPEGLRLFEVADEALLSLQAVLGELAGARAPRAVTVSCSVGVAGLWLLPRLRALGDALPDVEVRVMTANRLIPDLQREGVDLAIRYAPREGVPDAARALFPEAIAPVAHRPRVLVAQRRCPTGRMGGAGCRLVARAGARHRGGHRGAGRVAQHARLAVREVA